MKKKYKIGYTTGVFDMFHIGHLNILRNAKKYCDYLVVGVTTDALCVSKKGKQPIIHQEDRKEIVGAIKYVDETVWQENMDKFEVVRRIRANVVFVGSDWKGTPSWIEYEKQFAEIGCDVVYLDHTDGISSTILREKLNEK